MSSRSSLSAHGATRALAQRVLVSADGSHTYAVNNGVPDLRVDLDLRAVIPGGTAAAPTAIETVPGGFDSDHPLRKGFGVSFRPDLPAATGDCAKVALLVSSEYGASTRTVDRDLLQDPERAAGRRGLARHPLADLFDQRSVGASWLAP